MPYGKLCDNILSLHVEFCNMWSTASSCTSSEYKFHTLFPGMVWCQHFTPCKETNNTHLLGKNSQTKIHRIGQTFTKSLNLNNGETCFVGRSPLCEAFGWLSIWNLTSLKFACCTYSIIPNPVSLPKASSFSVLLRQMLKQFLWQRKKKKSSIWFA